MQSFTAPLKSLYEQVAWFMRDHSLKLLSIRCSPELRNAALQVIQQLEWHADNFSPLSTLEASAKRTDPGWLVRLEALDAQHLLRQKAMLAHGLTLPDLPERSAKGDPLEAFAARLARLAYLSCPPLKGHLVLLAPAQIEDEAAWLEALTWLLQRPELRSVRWIALHVQCAPLEPLLHALGTKAQACSCEVNPAQLQQDASKVLGSIARAATGELPPNAIGGTWPKGVKPPPRPGKTKPDPALLQKTLAAAGHSETLDRAQHGNLISALVRAIQAQREGRTQAAVRAQLEALRSAQQAGLGVEALLLRMTLAGFQVQAEQPDLARGTFQDCVREARALSRPDIAAQALLGVGALYLQARELTAAAQSFEEAGTLAVDAKLEPLAIEAHRLAGQASLESGRDRDAQHHWTKALELANACTPEVALATSVHEAARALAQLHRSWGRVQEALAIEHGLESLLARPPEEAHGVGPEARDGSVLRAE